MKNHLGDRSSDENPGHEASPEFSWGPRWVSTRLDSEARKVYLGATVFFALVFLATIWPVHAFFSRIRPFVLGLPFSLFYLAALLIATFAVLLGVFVWEGRREAHEEEDR